MSKHQLFYSRHCKHSANLIDTIQKLGKEDEFIYISVDTRYKRENITYVQLPNGQSMPIPPMIHRVPTVLLIPNNEILVGDQINEFIQPPAKNIEQANDQMNMEPNPYSITNETIGGFGVMSDNFSFLDSSIDELSAQGNGGQRQMYNYSGIEGIQGTIETPLETDGSDKMKLSMDEIENQRNLELKY
jgi:hypothetical protein